MCEDRELPAIKRLRDAMLVVMKVFFCGRTGIGIVFFFVFFLTFLSTGFFIFVRRTI